MKRQAIDTSFVSDIDKFLTNFDQQHAKTASQQAEIDKYQRISKLRDDAGAGKKDETVWEEF